jgi:hypothetical protein
MPGPGIYLHIFRLTIVQIALARAARSRCASVIVVVREKRKVRVLPRARVEPSG